MKKVVCVILILVSIILSGCIEENRDDTHISPKDYSIITDKYINWDIDQSPIYINSSIYFSNNTQLNISSGVEIIINQSVDIELEGNLFVLGSETDPVVINSKNKQNKIRIFRDWDSTAIFQNCIIKNISFLTQNADWIISNSYIVNSLLKNQKGHVSINNSKIINSNIEVDRSYLTMFNNSLNDSSIVMKSSYGDIKNNQFRMKYRTLKGTVSHGLFRH